MAEEEIEVESQTDSVSVLSASTAAYSTTTAAYDLVKYLKLPNDTEYLGQTDAPKGNLPNGLGLSKIRISATDKHYFNLFIGRWNCASCSDTINESIGTVIYGNSNARYEGQVELSLAEEPSPKGFGQIIYPDGSLRMGKFEYSKMNGIGIEIDAKTGNVYLGSFSDDKFNGHGVCYLGNGDVYTGSFQSGLRNGYGEYMVFSGNKSSCYSGLWIKDTLQRTFNRTDKNVDFEVIEKSMRTAERFSEKSLKVFEVFHRSILRNVASSRTKIVKMLLFLKTSHILKDQAAERFVADVINSKLYASSCFSSPTSVGDIKERIMRSIQLRDEAAAFDSVESEPVHLQPNKSSYRLENEQSNSFELFSKPVPRQNDILRGLEEEISVPSRSAPEPALSKPIPSTREKLIENSESFLSLESRFSSGAARSSRISRSEEQNINQLKQDPKSPNSLSSLGYGSFSVANTGNSLSDEDAEYFEEDSNVADVLANLFHSEQDAKPGKEGVPTKPELRSVSSKDNYFTYRMKQDEGRLDTSAAAKPKESDALRNAELRNKVRGVRAFISSKFHGAPRSNVESAKVMQFRSPPAEEARDDGVLWREIYARALEEEEESVVESGSVFGRKIISSNRNLRANDELLRRTLEGAGMANSEDSGEASEEEEEEEEERSVFEDDDSSSQVDKNKRQYFQTSNLVAGEFIRQQRTNQGSSRETSEEDPRKSVPVVRILPPSAPPPPIDVARASRRPRDIGTRSGRENEGRVRLFFEKQPHPNPPSVNAPSPPKRLPFPPKAPPLPPSEEPRPPKRPPYPPPI